MSLTELWKVSREQLKDKQIQQIIAFAGDGRLGDQNTTSSEFREFLANIPSDILIRYAAECLEESFRESGFALQDIINQVGVRLGFDVRYGRYRGTTKQIGFDGLWRLPNDHAIIVEVKTTDAYRIDLDRIAEYRRTLIGQQEIVEGCSSILIVVGRKETADLEAQIRGSRHAWDIRLISTDALIQLMLLKESLEDPKTIHRIYDILIPREFTRLDEIIEILFSTTEETQQEEDLPEEEMPIEAVGNLRATPKAFHTACIARVEKHLQASLVKSVRSGYTSPDGQLAVTCIVSKVHERRGHPFYWFAFHPSQREFLARATQSFVALGCGSETNVLLIPLASLESWLNQLWTTTTKDNRTYWHLHIHFENTQWLLGRKEGLERINLSEYFLP